MFTWSLLRRAVAGLFVYTVLAGYSSAWAASCCGGGSATSLILPKYSAGMIDVSVDYEHYNGFWDVDGYWKQDPVGSDLNQYRLNLSYAHRFSSRWQGSMSLPYAWNRNEYSNLKRNTDGIGDSSASIWYESFDNIACVWAIRKWQDWLPAVYWGSTLTVPTGTSPYDDVDDNFDTTGRGFYRMDASVLLDKTVYPWNSSVRASYGKHLKRDVNREYGSWVAPYEKELGERFSSTFTFGHTYFTDEMESITTTLAFTYLKEDKSQIDGITDTTSGFQKKSIALTGAWASDDRDWIAKVTLSHAPPHSGWGRNFSSTNILSFGVSHVLR